MKAKDECSEMSQEDVGKMIECFNKINKAMAEFCAALDPDHDAKVKKVLELAKGKGNGGEN